MEQSIFTLRVHIRCLAPYWYFLTHWLLPTVITPYTFYNHPETSSQYVNLNKEREFHWVKNLLNFRKIVLSTAKGLMDPDSFESGFKTVTKISLRVPISAASGHIHTASNKR